MKTLLADAALAGLCVVPAAAGVAYAASGGERASVILLAVLLAAATLAAGAVFVCRGSDTRRAAWLVLAPAIGLAVNVSVAVNDWPLRMTYMLARPDFEAAARRVRSGEPVAAPLRCGIFTVQSAALSPRGIVCLWTDLDPNGKTGFVQCPPDDVPFNLWSMVRLDDRWQFIRED